MSNENSNKSIKIAAIIAILLFLGAGAYLIVEMGRRGRAEDQLNGEKLKSESLLSEKLSLEKMITKLKSDIQKMSGRNKDLDEILKATETRLAGIQQELNKTKRQNTSVDQLKKQQEELKKIKGDLEKQLADHRTTLNQLQNSNDELTTTNSLLREQNQALHDEVAALRMESMDHILVQSQKKNTRLTAKARSTRKLIVDVDVPSNADNLKFHIIDPNGKELTSAATDMAITVIGGEVKKSQPFYMAAQRKSQQSLKRVEMIYTPKVKLVAGTYTIVVQNEATPIGSLQVKLR